MQPFPLNTLGQMSRQSFQSIKPLFRRLFPQPFFKLTHRRTNPPTNYQKLPFLYPAATPQLSAPHLCGAEIFGNSRDKYCNLAECRCCGAETVPNHRELPANLRHLPQQNQPKYRRKRVCEFWSTNKSPSTSGGAILYL